MGAALTTLATFGVGAAAADAAEPQEKVYGVTSVLGAETLTSVPSTGGAPTSIGAIGGLNMGETVVSMDIRPATGELYALTSDKRIVKITGLSALPTATTFVSGLTYTGTPDIDFNPVPDAIRLVTTSGNNLRIPIATGVVATDSLLNGAATGASGAAYTNPVQGPQQTTLYDIGTSTLYTQGGLESIPSPNGGTLSTVGALGGTSTDLVGGGFDISPNSGRALTLRLNGAVPTLYDVSLQDGSAEATGAAVTDLSFHAIAIAPAQTALSLSTSAQSVTEGTSATITVRRTGDQTSSPTFTYTVTPGTASAADIGTATPAGTIAFAAGETTKTITVPTVDDLAAEGSETFTVAITPTGATAGAPTSQTVTILDNDAAYSADSETAYGVTRAGQLVSFSTATPGTATTVGTITGLGSGETVLGIDVQPRTGRLFAVTSASKVYSVSKTTAAATQVAAAAFTPAAIGTSFGIDFNPVPNAIRFLSSGGASSQSLRISPDTGAVLGTDTAPTGTIAAAAYTNSVNGANSSTLYAIDSASDELVRIGGPGGVPSPNAGARTVIGAIGADLSGDTGLDISGASGTAYVSANGGTSATLHKLDLSTGRAGTGTAIGAGLDVIDIAIDAQPGSVQFSAAATAVREDAGTAAVTITRTGNTDNAATVSFATTGTGTATAGADFTAVAATPVSFAAGETSKVVTVPVIDDRLNEAGETIGVAITGPTGASLGAPNAALITIIDNDDAPTVGDAETVFGVTRTGQLVRFSTNDPSTVAIVGTITGLDGSVLGIDIQPRTGRLFAVTSASKVYVVDRTTAAATQVGSAAFTPAAIGTSFGIDFNPVPNAIRFLSSGGASSQSLRLSPDTGAVLGTDTAPTGTIAAAAYTNSVNGANSTTLYAIDSASDKLVRIGGRGGSPSPNAGAVTEIGALGADVSGDTGFDISGATNAAYVSANGGGAATLHKLDLTNGRVGTAAPIGTNLDVVDIAIDAQPGSVQFSAAATAVREDAGNAVVTITRTGNTDTAATVSFATTATGTATAGADFTVVAATPVAFAAGETSKTVSVPVLDDGDVEGAETIGVAITGPTGASLGAPNAATITVFDNDPATVTTTGNPVPVPVKVTADQVLLISPPTAPKRASIIGSGLRLRASCAEACSLSFTLKLGSKTLGTVKGSLADRGVVVLRLKLTSSGKKALNAAFKSKKTKSRTLTLTGTATDADGGKPAKGTATVLVVR